MYSIGMPYRFNSDFTHISHSFSRDLATITQTRCIHMKRGDLAQYVVRRFNVDELTGLNVTKAITLIEDLLTIHTKNLSDSHEFEEDTPPPTAPGST
jgi:hypothetical protein